MINKNIKIILALLLIVLAPGIVNAQTIGGEVFTEGNLNPAWQNVFVYDINNVGNYREIRVSPQDNKYSFSNVELNEFSAFGQSSIIRSEILDFLNGVAAGPVDMDLSKINNKYYSCSDCDIFQKMELREVAQVSDSLQELYISDRPEFDIEINVYDDCDSFINYNNTVNQFCSDGCDYADTMEVEFGLSEVEIITDCHTGVRDKKGSIPQSQLGAAGEFVNFEKELNAENLRVNFYGDKSNINVPVVDFVPDEYEIYNVSHGGRVYDEDGYYAIEWENSSLAFDFGYSIMPKSKLSSCDYGAGAHSFKEGYGGTIDLVENDFYSVCNFSKDLEVYIVESVDFSRNMELKIKNNEKSLVKLVGAASENVSVELREYVSVLFDVSEISDGGIIEQSSSDYNVIIWNVNSSNFDFSYSVTPSTTGDFSILSELGSERIDETNISVYNYIAPIGKSKGKSSSSSGGGGGGSGSYKFKPKNKTNVGPSAPLITEMGNMRFALYSKNFTTEGALESFDFEYNKNVYNRSIKFLEGYLLQTNLGNNADKFSFEFNVNKSFLLQNKYSKVEFYGVNKKGSLFRLSGHVSKDSGEDIIYSSTGNEFVNRVVVMGVKSELNFWDKLLEFLYKAFRFRSAI